MTLYVTSSLTKSKNEARVPGNNYETSTLEPIIPNSLLHAYEINHQGKRLKQENMNRIRRCLERRLRKIMNEEENGRIKSRNVALEGWSFIFEIARHSM